MKRFCSKITKHTFKGGFFESPKTVFDRLEEIDIVVPQSERYYTYFAVYDFECTQEKNQVSKSRIRSFQEFLW